MEGQVNCMHSKLMLLFHPDYLRIAVPSANLVPYDWGEGGGVMENVGLNILVLSGHWLTQYRAYS